MDGTGQGWALWALLCALCLRCGAEDIVVGCGGFVKSDVDINYSLIEIKLYTKQGTLKYQTDCAPNNGYFMIPLYDKQSWCRDYNKSQMGILFSGLSLPGVEFW
ncbi:unnamed protein product [Ranitomeya imitator]|uniref:NOMO-like N-terminal beta-sandwich domain-containing protein n=1 Tax=Ranitomeya imitator TaxID=111125 RepID=A0ABN9MKQ0_9NEOB|nr:unnamed protein product [Ranitomeya imitator]